MAIGVDRRRGHRARHRCRCVDLVPEFDQIGSKNLSGLIAPGRIFGHRARNDPVETRRHCRVELGRWWGSLSHDAKRDFEGRSSFERVCAGCALVERDSERENVAAGVGLLSSQLLGRHESRRANDVSGLGQTLERRRIRTVSHTWLRDSRESEIQHLHLSARRDDDVLRFDVAMDDAGGVGFFQRLRRLYADIHHFAGR